MHEKRRLKRRRLAVYPDVIDRFTGTVIGKLADLTPGGVMIVSPTPLETNTTHYLRLVLPEPVNRKKWIDIEANAAWCRQDVNPDLHTTGFEFRRLPESDARIISRLIFEYGLEV